MTEKVLEKFDYRKGTIALICPNCDKEITESEVNEFTGKEVFPKKLVPVISIKRLEELCKENDWTSSKYALAVLLSKAKEEAVE